MSAPKTISLFSGAGGLDYGFEAAGFSHGVAVEMDGDCCSTLRASRDWEVIERDIHGVPTNEILARAAAVPGGDTVLIGGPPCQPFSKSGWWASGDSLRMRDPRATTLRAYLRVLAQARPKAFLLENVEGLAYRGKDEGLRGLLRRIRAINRACGTRYAPAVITVSAADYGVPQLRTRVIVVGMRDGTRFTMPEPTHGDGILGRDPLMTAWDAIGDLGPGNDDVAMRGKWADLLPTIPEGENYLFHTERGAARGGLRLFGWRRRYWNFLLKLAKDRPAWTVQAQPGPATGPFHWDNRRLTVRELARIQTFPTNVELVGTLGSMARQVGNAVPSLLAEVIARAVMRQAFGIEQDGPLRLMPERRSPMPPARPPVPVPSKYLALVDAHPAHPGTGKGYSYPAAPLAVAGL